MSTAQVKRKKEENMNVLKIDSPKLGAVEYAEEDIITLSSPILGFPDLSDFLLISNDKTYPFLWFQSVEEPSVCFILIEPDIFFPDYKPSVQKRELKVLGFSDQSEDPKLFGIVVVPDDPKMATVNLRAPLVVNFERKLAKQVILDDDALSIKTPLFNR